MNFDEYQRAALRSAIYPTGVGRIGGVFVNVGLDYVTMKLAGEVGEVAEKIGKIRRDKQGIMFEADREALKKELGDVLWYVTAMANELGFDLEDVARANLEKLASRAKRGTLGGSGDDR